MGSRLENRSKEFAKRIEAHTSRGEDAEEYNESKFGGFADYMRRKKLKLQNVDAELRAQTADNPKIFKGVVAAVNGYTQPSMNDLHRLIVSYGGGFLQYLDGKTSATHIIASSLTPKKAIEFRRYRVVKPQWVVDSVAAGKLLSWENYRVVDEGVKQKVLQFGGDGKLGSDFNTNSRAYKDQMKTSWYTEHMRKQAEFIEDDKNGYNVVTCKGFRSSPKLTAGSQTSRFKLETSRKPEQEDIDDESFDERPSKTYSKAQAPNGSNEDYSFTSNWEEATKEVPVIDRSKLRTPSPLKIDQGKDEIEVSPQKPIARITTPMQVEEVKDDIEVTPQKVVTPAAIEEPSKSPTLHGRKRSPSPTKDSPSKRQKPMTEAELHNVQLLKNPKMRQGTTANPDFLKQFFSESRLHHLSTWKADLKAKFQAQADAATPSQLSLAFKRKPGARRYIMHVDFDSFFCAVSLLAAPEFKDKPTVVAHGGGPGAEIASCNYPARAFGVKNGMWMKRALELCPDIKVLPYDFKAYEEVSQKFYECVVELGGVVQSVSIDECLVDITSLVLPAGGSGGLGVGEGSIWREQDKANELGHLVRKNIKERTGCEVSVGIGGNILLAKVALRKAKPAGLYQIRPEEVLDFLGELTVQDLPGFAYSIGGKLEELGVKFVKDVRTLTKDRLMTVLGPKTGEKLWDYSRGIDKTEVGQETVRKSVSAEVNWGIRFTNQQEAEDFIMNLCGELTNRLVNVNVRGRQLTMKIMRKSADAPLDPPKHLGHGKCDVFNKSVVLGVATNKQEVLGREAISILRSFNFPPGELRGLGVQMMKLEPVKSAESSQKRLSFAKAAASRTSMNMHDSIEDIDDPVTPQKPKAQRTSATTRTNSNFASFSAKKDVADIEDIDPDSPQKPYSPPVHPAQYIAHMNAKDPSAKKKLNMLGTQFIMPTQVDKTVLAELPENIRSRLMRQGSRSGSGSDTPSKPPSRGVSRVGSPFFPPAKDKFADTSRQASRSVSPTKADQPPLPSQVDPEVFAALPDDVKAEVLAEYSRNRPTSPTKPTSRQQSVLPQSPRKVAKLGFTKPISKPAPASKKLVPFLQRSKKPSTKSKLTQASFMLPGQNGESSRDGAAPAAAANYATSYAEADIDPDFLAHIPESMRREVIAEHRAARLRARSHLKANIKTKQPVPVVPKQKHTIKLPPRPAKPTFTTDDLKTPEELRGAVTEWVEDLKDDDEGPEEEDARALARYLRRVVLEEKDTGKAVAVVKWLEWCVGDQIPRDKRESWRAWQEAVKLCKVWVDEAAEERGLGKRLEWDV